MILKKIAFALLLVASLGSEVFAQTRLSYGDTNGPFIDFPTNLALDSQNEGDSIVIGYAERFDLPPGIEILDSVDFIIDSIGTDSTFIDLNPVMTVETSNSFELLPDIFSTFTMLLNQISDQSVVPGSRTTVSCNQINVSNSFFIFLVDGLVGMGNTYRAIKRTSAVDLDTARAALIVNDNEYPFVYTELVDSALVPSGVNVDMDIGITYEGSDGVQVHLSPSSYTVIAYPNPAPVGNPIRLNDADSVVSAEVVDEAGRIVRNYQVGNNNSLMEIPTQGLSSGVYNVVLFHSDGSATSVKFVVE